jgi:hypothetical protein
MIFVGVDWAEAHHDVCVLEAEGAVLARKRIPDSLLGVIELHALVADHLSDDDDANDVIVGIEKDRGLIVTALVAASYQVFAVNPLAASRYRERHHVSGAKSNPGDAKMLADLVRTDRHNHRAVAGDSSLSDAIKLLARTYQNTIWNRRRQVNSLRSASKDYYPGALDAFGTDHSGRDAVAILAIAPTPALGAGLSREDHECASSSRPPASPQRTHRTDGPSSRATASADDPGERLRRHDRDRDHHHRAVERVTRQTRGVVGGAF